MEEEAQSADCEIAPVYQGCHEQALLPAKAVVCSRLGNRFFLRFVRVDASPKLGSGPSLYRVWLDV